MIYHKPVLLQEIIEFLDPKPDDLFIDATVGGGGHAIELVKNHAKVLGIDRDPEAIDYIRKQFGKDLILVQGNFSDIGRIAREKGFEKVNGILFDLGVSSHQLEKAERGFSFLAEGPLDMRMDPNLVPTAYDLVNNLDQRRLNEILKTYGQEKFSWTIARAIVSARQIKPIETTTELAGIIKEVYRKRTKSSKLNPATKTFQSLRIVVNSELLNLESCLPQTPDLLKIGGRLAAVSFHSLEDRIVKRFFKSRSELKVLTQKPIGPQSWEIEKNPRSRSAKLRVAERVREYN